MKPTPKIVGKNTCRKCGKQRNGILPATGWCRKCTLEAAIRKATGEER